MRKLLELDLNNYQGVEKEFIRTAVRGIMIEKPFLYMIRSDKYLEYKFPGGGMEEGESKIDTLKREVLEESGIIISDDIKPYGYVNERRKSTHEKNTIFVMNSYYYLCGIKTFTGTQNLDAYEIEHGYKLEKVHIDCAIKNNQELISGNTENMPWVYRELEVLKLIKDELF